MARPTLDPPPPRDPIDWTAILGILLVVAVIGLWLGRQLAGCGR